MKIGYFEVQSGCAGDMLVASLLDAGLDIRLLKKELTKLPFSDYSIAVRKVDRPTHYGHNLKATIFEVKPGKNWLDSTSYSDICKLIDQATFSSTRKKKIKGIFQILAEGESKAHGEPISKVHFHQVGQVDALVEVAGVVAGLELLGIEKVYCSQIGLANPAPATSEIGRGMPVILTGQKWEITTPTGISIIKAITELPGFSPEITLTRVGYGAGTRLEPAPNVVRFMEGLTFSGPEQIQVIETNLDDINPLFFDRILERLFQAGALDVGFFPGQTKKNRPVFDLKIQAPLERFEQVAKVIFEETTTLGLRYRTENRLVLDRKMETVDTTWGKIPVKIGFFQGKPVNIAPEYDVCKKISRQHKVPLKKVYQEVCCQAKC